MQIKQLSTLLFAVVLGLTAFAAQAQRTPVPIVNYENQSWPSADGKQRSAEEVKKLIQAAIQEHKAEGRYQWQAEPTSDGKLLATVQVRNKHTVRVRITNTPTTFSAVYDSSIDMKAGKDETGQAVIHPYYNRWAGDLVKAIKDKLGKV